MSFQSNFKEMLSADGKISSKRVITFVAFICIVIAFFGNVIFTLVVEPTILNGMISIVYAGLGVTVGEHLLKKRNGENPNGVDSYDDTGNQDTQDQLGDN